jgi:hypothetical protein
LKKFFMLSFILSAALATAAAASRPLGQLETARLPQAKQREEFGAAAFKFSFADLAKV